jgi:hypothetical protein
MSGIVAYFLNPQTPEQTMGKFNGGKFNGNHTTVVDAADDLVKGIDRIPEVKKISLGMIQKANGYAPLRMKVMDERAGAKLTIRAGTFTQEIYVYFEETNRKSIKAQLESLAPAQHDHKQGKPKKKAHGGKGFNMESCRDAWQSDGVTSWYDELDRKD